jgi:hypothetical protein
MQNGKTQEVLVVGEEHMQNPAQPAEWIKTFYKMHEGKQFPLVLLLEETEKKANEKMEKLRKDEKLREVLQNESFDEIIKVSWLEKNDKEEYLIDLAIKHYGISPPPFYSLNKLSKEEKEKLIINYENEHFFENKQQRISGGLKLWYESENAKNFLKDYEVPLNTQKKLENQKNSLGGVDFFTWKNMVLTTGIGRLRENAKWYQRIIEITNELKNKDRNVIVIIGNAHLGTVSVNQLTEEQKKENDIILGVIPHLVAEANTNIKQPFGKIHWGCTITPETTFKEKHTGLSKECDSNDNGHCNALEFIESTNASILNLNQTVFLHMIPQIIN